MKTAIKMTAFLLAFVLTLTMVPAFTASATVIDVPANTFTDYYGRSALEKMPNSTALLYAYDNMAIGVGMSLSEISVYNGTDTLSLAEFDMVLDVYIRDYAHHFWLGNQYRYSSYPHTIVSFNPQYLMTGDALDKAKTKFELAADMILSHVNDSMSDYEKELVIHDVLVSQVEYVMDEQNVFNAYGALVNGRAVCEGYAEAFQYLLHRVGIQSFLVIGSSKGVGHEWNIVRIDGEYYHVDPTWDDQGDTIYHAYFNMSDAMITEDHNIDATAYAMPECNNDKAHYFSVSGHTVNTIYVSVEEIAGLFKESMPFIHVFVKGDAGQFIQWYYNNIRAIANKVGVVGGFSYGYSYLGREVVLKLDGYVPEPDPAPDAPDAPDAPESDPDPAPDPAPDAPDAPKPEYILGDVSGDGFITNADVLMIYRYIYNSELYPLDLKVGDVSGDGFITNADVLMIFRYIFSPELYPIG